MKAHLNFLIPWVFLATTGNALAAVRYVDANSAEPAAPYTNWATAARVIQDAVEAAAPGDEIVVTNGLYATGGRAMGTNRLPNRVMVNKPLRLRSVNGPQVTLILGEKAPNSSNGTGEGAIRCVYLGDGASLSGFTLTNGGTRMDVNDGANFSGGGVWCVSSNAVLTNCILTGSSAHYGGGSCGGTLDHCVVMGNSAGYAGGGSFKSALYHCTISGNSAVFLGGGTSDSTLSNCTLTGNSARYQGGGAYQTTLRNSVLTGNSAIGWVLGSAGGGAYGGVLYNCTLTGNLADDGGGAYGRQYEPCSLYNCLVYFNRAGRGVNYAGDSIHFEYSCSTPLPPGRGNIDVDPQLADLARLSPDSPCVGVGNPDQAKGLDLDGEVWASPPAIGADQPGTALGPINLGIDAACTNVAIGYAVSFTACGTGLLLKSVWDFDDGTVLTNQPYVNHAWTTAGNYTVRLIGYNDTYPAGLTTSVRVTVRDSAHFYVNAAGVNPRFPYASWETAATNIQDAIGAGTQPGCVVVVTNGVYQAGLDLTNAVMVRSVNGPEVTMIAGTKSDLASFGGPELRCAHVGDGSVLSGFTLTKGWAWRGGGVLSESFGVVTNCILTSNSAEIGGGVAGGTLYNCTLNGNIAFSGGWFDGPGGGAYRSTLYNCVVSGNLAHWGGGACGSTLYNCALTGNSALFWGGGAGACTLYNCTLTGNSSGNGGGGVIASTLYNCIVFFNRAVTGANHESSTLAYSCATPLPAGPGNIDADPQLASATHLSPISPCIGAGSAAYTTGTDIDSEPWATPPAMGADQLVLGNTTGRLSLSIDLGFTNVATGYAISLTARNAGPILKSVWDFGDGTRVTNQPFASHAWSSVGIYMVRLIGYNDHDPAGVTTAVAVTVTEEVYHVSLAGGNPVYPYSSWATAATNIQDAIAAGTAAGRLVLVTNGAYRVGTVEKNGALNRVVLTNEVLVRSVNGPQVTVIEGATEGVRCAYVEDGSILSGFTLTKGMAESGGGVWCEATGMVTNCLLIGNSAPGWSGGGACGGILYHCTLTGNSAYRAGAASGGKLHNCVITANSANSGPGGVESCILYNCTITGNSQGGAVGCYRLFNCIVFGNHPYDHGGDQAAEYSCATPLPSGPGNIAADPRFMNAAAGDFRLRPDSPCINAGNNAYAPGATDLDDRPRIVNSTVDIGAYEFQGLGSTISYAWLQHFGLPTDGSVDFVDSDADGHNTWQEWRCQTDPANALSALRLLSASSDGTNVTVHWQSAAGVTYFLERSSNVSAASPFSLLARDIPGQAGTTSYADMNAARLTPLFYRVGVK